MIFRLDVAVDDLRGSLHGEFLLIFYRHLSFLAFSSFVLSKVRELQLYFTHVPFVLNSKQYEFSLITVFLPFPLPLASGLGDTGLEGARASGLTNVALTALEIGL